MYTIDQLKKGECAVINDGTLEELRKVLKLAFPVCNMEAMGTSKYYCMSKNKPINWACYDNAKSITIPAQSVKDFVQPEFKKGELVMVRDYVDSTWLKRIYLTTIPELERPYLCVQEERYKRGDCKNITTWKYIHKIEEEKIVELTLQEISEKIGIPVNLLRIKD